jgi:Protein of unknown function (DUF3047)
LIRMRHIALAILALMLTGCATGFNADSSSLTATPIIPPFSTQTLGQEGMPKGWEPWTLSRFKKETRYELVDYNGIRVVKASADQSASGLIYRVRFDPVQYPVLRWRWKVPALNEAADNTQRHAEDSPVRIIVAFDGPVHKLPPLERIGHTQFRMLTGQTLPYATLMYIWENRAEPETVIDSAHTSRIKMVVAESGAARVGNWSEQTRNIHDDYVRAFGMPPPPVKWIGIMSDSDNTGAATVGYYGDLEIKALAR